MLLINLKKLPQLLFNDALQHIQVKKNNHSIFINIKTSEGHITIGSHNSPPSANLQEDLQDWARDSGMSDKLLVQGDFNAHCALWGYASDYDKRHHLLSHMSI